MIGGKSVSGFVIAYNEEDFIGDCLESMAWADELIVVDSFSEDETTAVAGRYTDRIIQREFAGHVAQTRFAFEQTTGDWVLWLDADERLSPRATEQIHRELSAPGGPGCDGFALPRKTYFLDRWITHGGWYPQRKVRLMRRAAGGIVGQEPHPEAVVDGPVRRLEGDILHLSFPGGIREYAERSAAFADIAARGRFDQGKRASALRLACEPPLAFLKSYVLKAGFRDGVPGLAVAAGTAYHRFVRGVRLWELEHGRPPQEGGGDGS